MEGGEASLGGALSPAPSTVGGPSGAPDVVLREAAMGDLAAVMCQQAALYRDEFHYDPVFEEYLLAGAARFVQYQDPARDRLWVAEPQGVADGSGASHHVVGAIAVQHIADRPGWAQLRWFVVDGRWRGRGLGRRLMTLALSFARQAGYEGILLWTVDDLRQAARVYEAAGFRLAHHEEEPCRWAPWGHEQRWERLL